jgi:dTDP-4-dehydrorhamnose reductase
MAVWVPGAKGFVGDFLVESWPDALGSGREIDIADAVQVERWLRAHPEIRAIVNCAAFSAVDEAETAEKEARRANALGPEVLGIAARQRGLPLVHLSTDYVFSGRETRPLTEIDPTAPCNVYGKTKREGEERLIAVYPEACIVRTSRLYGRRGKNLVSRILELLMTKEEIRVTCDQIARPTYVPDLARVLRRMIGVSGLYHFANAGASSQYEFAVAVRKAAHEEGRMLRCHHIHSCRMAEMRAAAPRPSCTILDTQKIEALLGEKPRSWQETMREYVRRHETVV